ncbi:DNA primase [Arenibaculum pallidiluteum]|uniref:DNA primase n=1 Tax=Arenibaculum pallidiluteum TaxID=2812559 RepID=UPI001A97960C|nr:DNA primase [Arenibaculum pallidiluteum]
MAFPPQFLDELRARLTLSDIVGKRLRLIRAGREFKAPCPFHNEKTPSFYVNDSKGFFHCFGCGAHGDVVGFVMRHDNLGFVEAVELLSGEAGLQVPRANPEELRRIERQRSLYDLVEAACRFFEERLRRPEGRVALDYLMRRGVTEDEIVRFRLGYAPADRMVLRSHLLKTGFTEDDAVEAGVLRRPDGGGDAYSFFRDRVLFPVQDRRGRVVAFGGRILDGDGPKYLNSADNPLFHKGRLLYNMSRARAAAGDGKPVIVAEGYMDVIALVRAGFEGAVAPLGTALTETQILELWKLSPPGRRVPILCFDGDAAGRRAAFRAVERVLPHLVPDQTVRVAFLPEGQDPDDLVRTAGAPAMQEVLDRARPLSDVLWDMEAQSRALDTPEDRAGFEAALEERVRLIADRTVQAHYRNEIRQRLREAFQARRSPSGGGGAGAGGEGRAGSFRSGPAPLAVSAPDARSSVSYAEFKPRPFRGRPVSLLPQPREVRVTRRAMPALKENRERVLLALLLNHPSLFDEVAEQAVFASSSEGRYQGIWRAVVSALTHDSLLDAQSLYSHLCDLGFSGSLEELLGAGLFDHPRFAGPQATPEEARRCWDHVWAWALREHLEAELEEARNALARDLSEANVLRLQGVKGELEGLKTGSSDPDFDGR